jgi:hypothetical protein
MIHVTAQSPPLITTLRENLIEEDFHGRDTQDYSRLSCNNAKVARKKGAELLSRFTQPARFSASHSTPEAQELFLSTVGIYLFISRNVHYLSLQKFEVNRSTLEFGWNYNLRFPTTDLQNRLGQIDKFIDRDLAINQVQWNLCR